MENKKCKHGKEGFCCECKYGELLRCTYKKRNKCSLTGKICNLTVDDLALGMCYDFRDENTAVDEVCENEE